MKISGFFWLDDIVQKISWKHSVSHEEISEVFANSPRIYFVKKETEKTKMFMSRSVKLMAEDI